MYASVLFLLLRVPQFYGIGPLFIQDASPVFIDIYFIAWHIILDFSYYS